MKKSFPAKNQNRWYLTLGVNNGRQQNVVLQSSTSAGWQSWEENTQVGGYSKDHYFTDLYLDAGYAFQWGSSGQVSFAPFYKFRVNSTWVNTYLRESILGIKLDYSNKF